MYGIPFYPILFLFIEAKSVKVHVQECKLPHLVLSSLPNISRASHGRFTKVFHFDYKAQIEEWAIRELPGVTVLHPGELSFSCTFRIHYSSCG